jgi:ADP-ribose pyrophosphatase YjhB (NUDIX family)
MNLIGFADDQVSREQKLPEWLKGWNIRVAARAVLLDEQNKVALMYIGRTDSYKLPGGGVDEEERIETALKREMLEETGCTIEPICDIGIFLEKRDEWKMFQTSFCYLARVVEKGEPILTDEELAEGFKVEWIESVEQAIELVSNSKADQYDDLHMRLRDKNILTMAKKIAEEKHCFVFNKG